MSCSVNYAFQNQMKMSLLAHGKIGLGKKSHTPCFKKNSLIPWENMRKSKSGRALVEGSLNDVQCALHKNLWWGYRAPRAYPDCLRTLLTPPSELLPLIAGRSREDPFHEKQSNGSSRAGTRTAERGSPPLPRSSNFPSLPGRAEGRLRAALPAAARSRACAVSRVPCATRRWAAARSAAAAAAARATPRRTPTTAPRRWTRSPPPASPTCW